MLSIKEIWQAIEQLLAVHSPATFATLAPPATTAEIRALENLLGKELPQSLSESLFIHNGQQDPSKVHDFVDGGILMGTEAIAATWKMLTNLDNGFRTTDPDWDNHNLGAWWSKHWVPFTEQEGDCLCLNLDENSKDLAYGSVLWHVHDNPHEPNLYPSYKAWLQSVLHRLESGKFKIIDGQIWFDLDDVAPKD